jgi:topoisomerase-4 subunit A
VNRKEGFIGYGMKKDEFVIDCSDLDDVIAFKRDGTYKVVKIDEKVFVGKDIIHVDIFRKNDERRVYNAAYLDGKTGRTMVKRFQVLSVTRDREYDLTKGAKGSKVLYLEARPNGESEVINVKLSNSCRARVKVFDFDFAELEIKGRGAGGNILTKYPVKKIEFKLLGESSFGGLKIYYDQSVGKLNTDERGQLIGSFHGDDNILVIYNDGSYELSNYELTNRFDGEKVTLIEKFDPNSVISCVYFDGASKNYFVKRFQIETRTLNKPFVFISEHKKSTLTVVSTDKDPQLEIEFRKGKGREKESATYDFDMLIDVKGWKAIGNKLSQYDVTKVKLLESKKEEKAKEYKTGDSVELDVDDDKEQLGLF